MPTKFRSFKKSFFTENHSNQSIFRSFNNLSTQKSFKACKNISMSVSPSPGPVSPPVVWRSSPPRHHRLWSPLVNTEETQRRIWSPAVTCEEENKINKNNNNTSGLLVEVINQTPPLLFLNISRVCWNIFWGLEIFSGSLWGVCGGDE